MKKVILVLVLFLLIGSQIYAACDVSRGMSKGEVIDNLGIPSSITEIFRYTEGEIGQRKYITIYFTNGKVSQIVESRF